MLRRVTVFLAMAIGALFIIGACGSDDATPTPTGPTEYRLMFEDFMTPFAEFTRSVIADHSDVLTVVPQQVEPGEPAAFAGSRPEQFRTTIFHMAEEDSLLMRDGFTFGGPLIEPAPQALFGGFPAACTTLFTLDPDIRTLADLEGKRVHIGQPGDPWPTMLELLFRANNLWDKITPVIGGAQGDEQLADRQVDATVQGIIFQLAPTPEIAQLAAITESLFLVDIPEAALENMRRENDSWVELGLLQSQAIPKGNLKLASGVEYDIVREDSTCIAGISVIFMASAEADEGQMYNLVKTILDNRDEGDNFFPFMSDIWKDRVGHAWIPQRFWHPGARRAFEEAGVAYGTEGIREWESQQGG